MTTRLYYREPYRTAFEAVVTACDPIGGRYHVLLNQTAFYPTSGGQPFDVGTLVLRPFEGREAQDGRSSSRAGNVPVADVIDRDDGEIAHVTESPVPVGAQVSGTIDWTRRFDHMQQHTGQHVLSAAFDRLFDVRTESFHLGTAAATIDVHREVSSAEVARAEDEANSIVWENRPVSIRFATPEEAAALPLRKESIRTGPLRLIEVDRFDVSACGGTHVERTGAIGVIAIGGSEKFRGGSRIEFLCGNRALARFRVWRDAFAATMRHLSVAPEELAAGVERLQSESKTLQRTLRGLQEQLAAHEAAALLARGHQAGDRVVVVEAIEGWDAAGLKGLASAAATREPRAVVALFTTTSPAQVVVARGKDAGIDAGAVLKQLAATFGGKGGGRPELAQGGGLTGSAEELVDAARQLLGASSV